MLTNVLTARYLDSAPPLLKAAVYATGALAVAVVIKGCLQPPTESEGRAASTGKRRRDPACAIAVLPDGTKDRSNREWARILPPTVYASLRLGETDPPNLSDEDGGFDDVRGSAARHELPILSRREAQTR